MSDLPASSADFGPSRREFMKTTSAVVGGAMLAANARIARSAHISGTDEIKVALIGCGGRGTGAALQALETKGPVTLWAVADAFADNAARAVENVRRGVERASRRGENELLADSKVDVPAERQFAGFDAYQRAIDSGVDLVILATTPHFRPIHFEAAVKAGKHVFMEKPVAVDAPGIKRVLAANEEAKKKDLMVAVGLQRRHDPKYQDTIQRLKDGAIGDILATRVYWNGVPVWVRGRTPQQTEMEYQMRNWYYFNWLCGDHIVEQHIHNIDVSNWLRGMHPVEAQGMGGRQARRGKDQGQIFDHHFVEYTYSDGTKMYSQCRQITGCWGEVGEHAQGTKGTADIGRNQINGPDGRWRSEARGVNSTHQEHLDLFAALRKGEVYNEAEYAAESTMTAIIGRMATYTGALIKWDEAIESTEDLSPAEYDFAAAPPVLPDDEGDYPIPTPGRRRERSTLAG